VIDAGELLREVRDSIHGLAEEMRNDTAFRAQLVTYVRHIFADELSRVTSHNPLAVLPL